MMDCNWCSCTDTGMAICTLIACEPGMLSLVHLLMPLCPSSKTYFETLARNEQMNNYVDNIYTREMFATILLVKAVAKEIVKEAIWLWGFP